MWSKPTDLSAVGTARPLRVAYLIDPTDCPAALLDAIYAEAYSRWGGRRTLIVPASQDGIDPRYSEWLWYYDADVIYSFVDLTDSAVAHIHERHGPAHLTRHDVVWKKKEEPGYYRIQLPLQGLSSISVVPAFLGESWGIWERIRNLRIIDKYFDESESLFLKENFGFLSESLRSPLILQQFPELFTSLTLITREALDDRRRGKDPNSHYETDEIKLLEALGKRSPLTTVAQLSDLFAPYLDAGDSCNLGGLSLIAGDSVDDRLLFWNEHHRYRQVSLSEIASLRIPTARLRDTAFLTQVKGIILQRGKRDYDGHQDRITLHSCSVGHAELEEVAEILRKEGSWLAVKVVCYDSHAACVPSFRSPPPAWRSYSPFHRDISSVETSAFKSNRVSVPPALPWHMREAPPPPQLRAGHWMIDVAIDRLADHCAYSNVRHTWVLPRRLSLVRAFAIERPASEPWDTTKQRMRVNRDGAIALPHSFGQAAAVISIPEDLDAFRMGLCTPSMWEAFNRNRTGAPMGLPRYLHADPSDKGRYLLAVLNLFDSLPDAFDVLMDEYWRGVLQHLGAVTAESNPLLCDRLIRTLRKRLAIPKGDLVFSSEEEQHRLAGEAIKLGSNVRREKRYIRYEDLRRRWTERCFKGIDEGDP